MAPRFGKKIESESEDGFGVEGGRQGSWRNVECGTKSRKLGWDWIRGSVPDSKWMEILFQKTAFCVSFRVDHTTV